MRKGSFILVVEDDPLMREAVSSILEEEGFEVKSAQHGGEALSILAVNKKPDLILLDMVMPEMNGWEFAEEYRRTYKECAPIVVVTAAADGGLRAKDVGAIDWLGKPYPIADMLDLINRLEL